MRDPLGKREVTENLKDAGCSKDTAERFLMLLEDGSYPEQQELLRAERTRLLDALHVVQKRIDCLDYLIYQLRRCHNEKKTTVEWKKEMM